MNKKRVILGIAVVAAAVLIGMSLTKSKEVELTAVESGSINQIIEETGYVEAIDSFPLEITQYAQVKTKSVQVGDEVKAGQELVRLENLDLQTELESTQTNMVQMRSEIQAASLDLDSIRVELERAQRDLERQEQLYAAGSVSKLELEQMQNRHDDTARQYSQQQAYVQGLRAQLEAWENLRQSMQRKSSQLLVSSPVDGTVLDLPIEIGQVLAPGQKIAQLGSAARLQVRAEILSDDLGQVQAGQPVAITASILAGNDILGVVEKIYPQAYEKVSALGVLQRRVPVIITLEENDKLKPGYEVRVKIETSKKENILVLPREAVTMTRTGEYQVMLVPAGKVTNTIVEIGLKNQDLIEIISPLKAGDLVIRDGSLGLKDGTRVRSV